MIEEPAINSLWQHYNGIIYQVVVMTNHPTERQDKYPRTVVYVGPNGKFHSRQLDDWHRSMTAVNPSEEPPNGGIPELLNAVAVQAMKNAEAFRAKVVKFPIPDQPTLLSEERFKWFLVALREEIEELVRAYQAKSVEDCVDALHDIVTFTAGRVIEMGVPPEPPLENIHECNMNKEQGELAKRPGSAGFDAVKPDGWRGPDHSWMTEITRWDIENLRRRAARRKNAELQAQSQQASGGGFKFNAGKTPVSLIPWEGLDAEARALAHGVQKYGCWNHLFFRPFNEMIDGTLRHIIEGWMNGEDLDPESGVSHLGHARANLSILLARIANFPNYHEPTRRPSPVTVKGAHS